LVCPLAVAKAGKRVRSHMALKSYNRNLLGATFAVVMLTVMESFRGCVPTTFVTLTRMGSSPAINFKQSSKSQSTSSTLLCNSSSCTVAMLNGAVAAAALLRRSRQQQTRSPAVQRHVWGDPVDFYDAAIVGNVEAAQRLRLITIEAPPEVSDAYARGGQFVQAKSKPEDKPSFYAISSPPSEGGSLEFLIKDTESNSWITSTGANDVVQLSAAMGRGFDTQCEAWADVNQVALFATGSGIAPMRATIESGALKGKVCRFYVGGRTEEALAFADRFESWRQKGIEVVPVLSRAETGWSGRTGYVQKVFKEDEERGEGFVLPAKHGSLLCGQKEMVGAVRDVYSELGVPEERTLLNF